MNPDQPSREQIEARLTALLLGELPAAEAELLRWTISRDPELQKLHDHLKLTIGFVREAMKNPTGAPLDKETPLKLPQERRQTLLAHFKTVRPQPPQKLSWLRPIKVSPFIPALVAITIIAVLAAMLLPVLQRAKTRGMATLGKSEQESAINNMRQTTAAVDEWELEQKKSKSVHDLPASPSEDQSAKRNPQEPKVQPPQVQIALPNTESSQTGSEELAGVYSDGTVGYVNAGTVRSMPNASGLAMKTEKDFTFAPGGAAAPPYQSAVPLQPFLLAPPPPASAAPQVETETASSAPVVEAPRAYQKSPMNWAYSANDSAPQATSSIPPVPAGGTYNVAAAGNLPQVVENQNAVPVLGDVPTLGALSASKAENPPASLALMPPRLRQQYGQRNGAVNEAQSQPAWSSVTPIPGASITEALAPQPASAAPLQPEVQTTPTVTGWNIGVSAAAASPAANNAMEPIPNGLVASQDEKYKNVVNGTTSFGESKREMQNANAVVQNGNTPVVGSSPGPSGAWSANDLHLKVGNFGLADAASQRLQARGEAGSVNGSISKNNFNARFQFDVPTDSIANAVAVDKFTARVAASGQSGLTTREKPNAKNDLDKWALPPLSQQQYVQLDGDRNLGALRSVKQADTPLTLPPPTAPTPQPEIQTTDNAFSTFSMNVNDVSFKLAMASLQKGQMPDPASIRSEEFINAFDYHDPEPLQGEPLAFTSDRARDPFAQERDLLRFSIKAAAAGRQGGRALNLVLLLDTSGSMERADRVAIIREALRVLSAQLQPQDTVSVVTFARTARLGGRHARKSGGSDA